LVPISTTLNDHNTLYEVLYIFLPYVAFPGSRAWILCL